MALLTAVVVLSCTATAQATFPGASGGKLAFSARIGTDTSNEIYTYDVVTEDLDRLTDAPGDDVEPSWSPDGSELVFASPREDAATLDCNVDECDFDLYTVAADGSSETRLTTTPTTHERDPAWSPDGARIAFTSYENGDLIHGVFVMDIDGSDRERLFGAISAEDQAIEPTWSPDGDRLAFNDRFARIWVGNDDGTNARYIGDGSQPNWGPYHDSILVAGGAQFSLHVLNPDPGPYPIDIPGPTGLLSPAFSPDMGQIAVVQDGQYIYVMQADGSDRELPVITNDGVFGLDWHAPPTTVPGYVRPQSASPMRLPLVPAFQECTAPNSQHGPPLAFGSCNPPVQAANRPTVGTPDANGHPVKSVGMATITAIPGNPATPEDEADVRFTLDISDVRRRPTLADYTGVLIVPLDIQRTDRFNGGGPAGGPYAATSVRALDLSFGATCVATADTTEGARCSVSTTMDAIAPASVREGIRTTWEIGKLEVFSPAMGENGPFVVQGVFVP